jgi:hypothetical protein
MEKLINIEEARKNDIVAGAIEKETPCVVSRRGPQGWQPFKSRFVAPVDGVGRLLVHATEENGLGGPTALVDGERIGLTFRRGHKKCMCAVTVLAGNLEISDETGSLVRSAELSWPDALQELQRRVYHRAQPPGRRVHVRFWPGGVAGRLAAEEHDQGVLSGVMLDLSAGGISILTTDIAPDTFTMGDTLGCAFSPKPRGETLVLDATFRHFELRENGSAALGLQFVGLEASDRGRHMLSLLAGIVTDYQRGHARQERARLAGRFARA